MLNFKLILGTRERRQKFYSLLVKIGKNHEKEKESFMAFATMAWSANDGSGHFFFSTEVYSPSFENSHATLVTLEQAETRINHFYETQNPFPFKPFDKIIAAFDGYSSTNWTPEFFSIFIRENFWAMGSKQAAVKIAPYEGNEHLVGETIMREPEEWWEIENGKPVLKRKNDVKN